MKISAEINTQRCGSRMYKHSDPGSGIQDEHPESSFCERVKNTLNSLIRIRIRNPVNPGNGMEIDGSGINILDPQL
jgi:hypothetical protein